jgi:acyl-CoA dehydrogenase
MTDHSAAPAVERDGDAIDYGQFESGKNCNYWALDRTLQGAVRRAYEGLPDENADYADVAADLNALGDVTGTRLVENSEFVEANPPKLHTYDRNGEVVNDVEYHPALLDTERVTYCEFGLSHDVFHAGTDPDGDPQRHMRLRQAIAREIVLSYVDPGFVCPASMTVGAAIVLDLFGGEDERLQGYLDRLTTTDPEEYIEGAMFLTEKQGGSDVGAIETTAVETAEAGVYELTGEKWFCSNIDAEGTLALARREGAPDGTRGLSLFLVPHTREDGSLNAQTYRRLKDKLGTLSVPTGEVELHGAEAYLVGEPEQGFRYMTEMLNFERLSNAAASVGIVGRVLLESKVQAATREAFGSTIDQYPLMRRDLVEMATTYEAVSAFTMTTARLLEEYYRVWDDAADAGRDGAEVAHDSDEYRLLRLLVPIAKYRTAREAVDAASYACEILGGNGYVSGFATERMLRDAQVLPIWEGTSNVLSLEVLRVLSRQQAHEVLIPAVAERLDVASEEPALADATATVRAEFEALQEALLSLATVDPEEAQLQAKAFADYVFDVFVAAELLARAAQALAGDDAASETPDGRLVPVAREWVAMRFERPAAHGRGIADGSRRPLDAFDEIVRYAYVAPEDLDA